MPTSHFCGAPSGSRARTLRDLLRRSRMSVAADLHSEGNPIGANRRAIGLGGLCASRRGLLAGSHTRTKNIAHNVSVYGGNFPQTAAFHSAFREPAVVACTDNERA